MKLKLCLILGLFLTCSACTPAKKLKLTPASEFAVLNVVNKYLLNIVHRKPDRALDMLLWAEYVAHEDKRISKREIRSQIVKTYSIWDANNHPLMGFDKASVTAEGQKAVVNLGKSSTPEALPITVSLEWVGSGWLIVDDTLFGKGGFVTEKVNGIS